MHIPLITDYALADQHDHLRQHEASRSDVHNSIAFQPKLKAGVFIALLVTVLLSACSRHAVVDIPKSEPDSTLANTTQSEDSTDQLHDGLAEDFDDDLHDDLDADLGAEYNLSEDAIWQERVFSGNTRYTFSGADKGTIKGETNGTASILYRQQDINVAQSPWLNWRWKISNTYGPLNEKTRAGDDYPARFYIVVQTGALPWDTKAINYVWSSNGKIGDSWDNPFTKNAKMLVLQSGDQLAGKWLSERRNVTADFKSLFNLDIDKISGYAVMVDGDNSGSAGISWFSDIHFSEQ